MTDYKDLNGLWTGEYGYTGHAARATFTAWLDEAGGHVSGTTLEPNTLTQFGPVELEAIISGQRTGPVLTFTKTYSADSGAHQQPIRYEGHVTADYTEISGHWFFDNLADHSGPFRMMRSSGGMEEMVTRRASVPASANDA